jgi:UPF0755 protein
MRLLRLTGVLALVVLIAGAFFIYRLTVPYQGFQGPIFVELPRGTTTGRMADLLARAGVVRHRWDFLLARALDRKHVLQAGEYQFTKPGSPFEVVDRIERGDIFYYTLVVPEGKNMFDIAGQIAALGLFPGPRFLAEARNPELIRDLDPAAPTLEGYLFPDTYRLTRHATPESVCRMMTSRFRENWKTLRSNAPVHDTVTLASLVEKEGKLADERPRIAAVFENRIRIGMKLDCDPTTIYAALLEHHYNGTIRRSDLDSKDPYNTYRHAGLPPGPIANPGLASIRAVLHPSDSADLYFVRKPDDSGAHQFSRTLAEHEAATAMYRRGLGK